ncbi:MAG: hypothetical protein JWR89_3877 [Tardiphaga sp.]|uniref:hypothetical protein n=1 Tax=Tardiphaga sp. TaxID=1926292 RepID=UPI00261D2287|nr:hypothetical protein [Tardiphaga sp.]MDB5503975.1 hypothetical protein [Tardiphaga sp.]
MIRLRPFAAIVLAATLGSFVTGSAAQAQIWSWKKLPDQRGEFVRLCAPHMVGRWAHPESVCVCLHDHAVAMVEDSDLREALLRGISERGVPTIENDWVPASKQSMISATFTRIAKPTLQCLYDPAT